MAGFKQFLVCATPGRDAEGAVRCGEKGGTKLLELFRSEVAGRGFDPDIVVQRNPCSRRHAAGPVVFVFPDDHWYTHVTPEDVPEIVLRHLA